METINEIINNLYGAELQELQFAYKDDLVLTQPSIIYRANYGGGDRYYYRITQDETGKRQFIFYPSTTTFTKKVLPTSEFLLQWMKENGEETDAIRDLAADYGTLMHICLAYFLMSGWDYSTTREVVAQYVEKLGHHKNLISKWTERINKDVAAFAQFCRDYEIEPIMIEGMLASDELGIAGTLDLVCKMRTPEMRKAYDKAMAAHEKALTAYTKAVEAYQTGKTKVEPEVPEELEVEPQLPAKIIGQVDFKSGGIYDSSELQLAINRMIFTENFPGVKLEMSLNWAPKKWEKVPTYTVKDQTDTKFTYNVINAFLTIYEAMYPKAIAETKVFDFNGEIQNDGRDINQQVGIITLAESIEKMLTLRAS